MADDASTPDRIAGVVTATYGLVQGILAHLITKNVLSVDEAKAMVSALIEANRSGGPSNQVAAELLQQTLDGLASLPGHDAH
jgi:hypothetical protein